jgi:hypothetical protein
MNEWDEPKRARTVRERGLDFADAEAIFENGNFYTRIDDRHDYGEVRYITVGFLGGRFAVVAWSPRQNGRRIISLRYGHEREKARYEKYVG